MSFSVVILSKNIANLKPCVEAIWQNEPDLPKAAVIVVDDGLAERPDGPWYVKGEKPFIFSRNANIGIRAAGDDDIILLNDDALLKTPGGFTALEQKALAHPEYGVISAAIDVTGNPNQVPRPGKALRDEWRMVCYVCVYIRRAVLNDIGLLDERYVNYGADDDDHCFTARAKGYKLGIFDGCVIDHKSLKSTFRGGPVNHGDYRPNMEIFKKKWGCDNWGRPA